MPVTLLQGDITSASACAIVNAANAAMLGGGGVDGAIHRAAGPALLKACKKIPAVNGERCPAGEARITEAGNLDARFVIHTVGPRYGIDEPAAGLLASAYRNSLALARQHDCQRLAFPAISCGAYGYPLDEAAGIAMASCNAQGFAGLDICFYLAGSDVYDAFQRALTNCARQTLHGSIP